MINLSSAARSADGDKRLVKLLNDYSRRGPTTGFGFVAQGAEKGRRRELAIVCRVPSMEPEVIGACAAAGADALEMSAVAITPAALAQVEEAMTIPWGLSLREGSYEAWGGVGGAEGSSAAEWITLTMDDDARFLAYKGIARVLEVDINTKQETLRAISASGADVVIATASREATGPLSIAEALRLRLVCELLKQPVLIAAGLLHGDGGPRLAKECGAAGVLLETTDPQEVLALVHALRPPEQA